MAKRKQSKDQSQVLDLVLQGKNNLTEEVFDALYQEVLPTLFANRWRVPKYILENDDYYQEARICLVQAIETYRLNSKATFTTYFANVFKNRLLDIRRMHMTDKRIANFKVERSLDLFANEGEENSIENRLRTKEFPPEYVYLFNETITKYEDSLSAMEKTAYDYFKLGFSYEEMENYTGYTRKQVHSLIAKCKRKYRQILSEYFDDL
ncbi:sigma factor [Aerococcus sp. HMSC10H05]|uniref:sigma factor n=1 Tax=Aerococcus sp. HMSC10H05 TaxID=1581084 RepID=UPI0008A56F25|nr:sigma factor [Aerococcus sp. HMSC10H05]OFU49837.1 RNA polymerase subunit sigma-70 [Aerococcus sp. HMSC10H05]